jgi:hypothetical protein
VRCDNKSMITPVPRQLMGPCDEFEASTISIMDEATRQEIADCLERLAAEPSWNGNLWQRCYDLVTANWDDELLAYLHDDLVHYSGTPLFRSEPRPADLQRYSQEFRDFASALRARMLLAEFKTQYGW